MPATALRALGFALYLIDPRTFCQRRASLERALSKLTQLVGTGQNSDLRTQEMDPVVLCLDGTHKVTGIL